MILNDNEFKSLEIKLLNKTFIKRVCDDVGYDSKLLKSYIETSIEEAKYILKLIDKYNLKIKKY